MIVNIENLLNLINFYRDHQKVSTYTQYQMRQTYSVKIFQRVLLIYLYFNRSPICLCPYVMILAVIMAKNYNIQSVVSVLEQQHFDCGQKKAFLKHLMSEPSFRVLYISFSCEYLINSESNMCLWVRTLLIFETFTQRSCPDFKEGAICV